jgi:hypothetical protein
VLDVKPGEIALLPRGMVFKVALPDGLSRGYVCENYGAHFRLPELGPIGSNGLANARDFQAPVAAFEEDGGAYELVKKFGRPLLESADKAVALQRGRLARQPRAGEVRHGAFHDDRLDQLRPSRSVDLHGADLAERHARHRELRLRDLPAALAGDGETPSARPGSTATS